MKLLSVVVWAAFLSLRGLASSFGLAQNVDMLSSRKSSSASSTVDEASTCEDSNIDIETEEMHDTNMQKEPDKTPRLVKFVASRTHSTPPLPLPPTPATLDDFFSNKNNCNLLFSAKATLSDVDNPSSELYEMLKDSYSYFHDSFDTSMTKPDSTSIPVRFIELANAPMRFIGVTLHSTATVGIQYLQESDFHDKAHFGPEYHFYLLSTNLEARGPPPLVWLFYKLIGKKQGQEGISTAKASRFQTSGFTRVWAEALSREKKLVFHNTARLESRLRIPSVLLSLMPFSVEHLEEKGSAALQDAIDKDMEPAAERFQEAYTKWLSDD